MYIYLYNSGILDIPMEFCLNIVSMHTCLPSPSANYFPTDSYFSGMTIVKMMHLR